MPTRASDRAANAPDPIAVAPLKLRRFLQDLAAELAAAPPRLVKGQDAASYSAAIGAAEKALAEAEARAEALAAERAASLLLADDATLRATEEARAAALLAAERVRALLAVLRAELPALQRREAAAAHAAKIDRYRDAVAELDRLVAEEFAPAVAALMRCEAAAAAIAPMMLALLNDRTALQASAPEELAAVPALPSPAWRTIGHRLTVGNGFTFDFPALASLAAAWRSATVLERIQAETAEREAQDRRRQAALDKAAAARPVKQLHHSAPGQPFHVFDGSAA